MARQSWSSEGAETQQAMSVHTQVPPVHAQLLQPSPAGWTSPSMQAASQLSTEGYMGQSSGAVHAVP